MRRGDLDITTFRMLLALHMRWHFKHVWALDGSKNGERRRDAAAYGGWRGLKAESQKNGCYQ